MTRTTFREALPLNPRENYLKKFPQVKKNVRQLAPRIDALTLPALTGLEREFNTGMRIREEIAGQNYSYLEQIGFCFEMLGQQMVLKLKDEKLALQEGRIVYDEIDSQVALLDFLTTRYAALEAKYEELWNLWNTAPVGYHTLNRRGTITAVNETEARMLGYAVEEMRGKRFTHFVHPKQRELALNRFRQKLAEENIPPVQNRIYLRKDGSQINVSANDSVVRNSRGEVIGIKTVLVDISKLRELEKQLWLLIKQHELGQLAAGFAHEFGNLIGAILPAADAAKKMLPSDANPDLKFCLENIIDAANIARKLTESIRSYALTSKNDIMTEKIDPGDICRKIMSILKKPQKEGAPPIVFRLTSSNRLHIEGVEHQVSETIMNLCLNARDALPRGGQISIHIKDVVLLSAYTTKTGQLLGPGKYVVISVKDNGIGITAEEARQIFDPFFTTKDQISNSGFGLSILMRIMDMHGGGIDFESQPDKGSRFIVYFPGIEAD